MRRLGHDLLWDWVWRRLELLERLGRQDAGLVNALPDYVMELVAQDGHASASRVHTERALEMLERPRLADFIVERALIDMVVRLDHHDLVVGRLGSWAGGSRLQRHRLSQLLEAVSNWERFELYATAALAGDASPEIVDTVVWSREPSSFMGSRVPYYEAVRDRFAQWRNHRDGNLVRVALRAAEYFDARIAETLVEDRRRLEAYED
jgi:hypothetical protein